MVKEQTVMGELMAGVSCQGSRPPGRPGPGISRFDSLPLNVSDYSRATLTLMRPIANGTLAFASRCAVAS